MKINTVSTLLEEELKDIYDAEKRLVKALPKMAKAASSDELRQAFEEHLEVTKGHVQRLEQAFQLLGKPAKAKPCAAMKGLIEEGGEAIEQEASETLKDAALIGAAQRVEHYEMAAYGTVRALAEHLGKNDVAQLLGQTLNEEKEADQTLTGIAEHLLEGMADEAGEQTSNRSGKAPRTQTSKA